MITNKIDFNSKKIYNKSTILNRKVKIYERYSQRNGKKINY